MKNKLNSVNLKVMLIRGQIWFKFDFTHFEFFLLISIEICHEIELIPTTCDNATFLKKAPETFQNCSFWPISR